MDLNNNETFIKCVKTRNARTKLFQLTFVLSKTMQSLQLYY